ncbi:Ras1 guanine nucleotide exchange factor, partial [Trachipleistophora hominis]
VMLYELENFVSKKYGRPTYTGKKKDVKVVRNERSTTTASTCKCWRKNEFPLSLLLEKVESKEVNENVLYGKFTQIDEMNANEFGKVLHNLDLRLYRKIMPTEIVEYGKTSNQNNGNDENMDDGSVDGQQDVRDNKNRTVEGRGNETNSAETINNEMSENLKNIIEKNRALTALTSIKISGGLKSSFFVRVCRYLKKRNNYNSIVAILNGLRTHKTNRSFREFNPPKKYDPNTTFIILPIENILADVAISNQETMSEGANMFFYGIVKFFIMLQDKKCKVDVELEHAVMREMVGVKNFCFDEHEESRNIFLASYLYVRVRKNKQTSECGSERK